MVKMKPGLVCAFLLCFGQPGWSQELKPQATLLQFDVDHARYRTATDFIYLEVYYLIYRDQLQFIPEENRFRADFCIETKFFMHDSLVVRDSLDNVSYTDSLSQITTSQRLINMSGFVIRKGTYRMEVKITDLHSNQSGTKEINLEIQPISRTELAISDIELASKIQTSDTNDKFTKNQYQVIPNPSGVCGTGAPILYFYAEIYNLVPAGESKQYRSKYSLLDGNGNELRVFQDKLKDKPGTSSVEVSGLNIISQHSGSYFLRVEIEDMDSHALVTSLKKFYIYRPEDFRKEETQPKQPFDLSNFLTSPDYQGYDSMDEKALNAEFEGASYMATKEERSIYSRLDLPGKRAFMKKFWLTRDDNRLTLENEFRKEYLARLNYVNEGFGSGKPGWKSDRGRIYLLYGKSDEVERNPSSADNRAYEVWNYYNIQGGILFIFVDIRGFGDYILVHSTARDELQDQDWQRWISPQ